MDYLKAFSSFNVSHIFIYFHEYLIRNEKNLLFVGEWWHADVEAVVKQGNALGLPPNMSDAHTINGKPGPLFPCSEKRMS